MKVENISVKTNRAYILKQNVYSDTKFQPNAKLLNFVVPCDAQYLVNKSNINFKGKYNLTKLPKKELAELKADVAARISKLGINDFYISDNWEANYITQALDKLIKNPIMKLGNITKSLDKIKVSILTNHYEKEDSEVLLEFVDFLLSDNAKSVMKNDIVRDSLGDILWSCNHYNIEDKKAFINYLKDNPQLLKKNINLSKYIEMINRYNYDYIIEAINSPNTPNIPDYMPNLKFRAENTKVEEVIQQTKQANTQKKNVGNFKGFARVGGQNKAIETLQRKIIFPRQFPELYDGVKPEKGVILFGPPGTGKSLLAEALSEECDCYFLSIGASDMSERWVGASEENWRKLFLELKKNQPAILFIDEADALCKRRGGLDVHGDKELNQFLKLISDLKTENVDVSVILATNNIKAFDKAVLRDGRFGIHIEMLPPQNIKEAEEIFNIHKKNMKLDISVEENKQEILKKMLELNLTGAEIEGVLKESHDEALYRLGLFDKMRTNCVSKNDRETFSIKSEDIFRALAQRKSTNSTRIGFIKD